MEKLRQDNFDALIGFLVESGADPFSIPNDRINFVVDAFTEQNVPITSDLLAPDQFAGQDIMAYLDAINEERAKLLESAVMSAAKGQREYLDNRIPQGIPISASDAIAEPVVVEASSMVSVGDIRELMAEVTTRSNAYMGQLRNDPGSLSVNSQGVLLNTAQEELLEAFERFDAEIALQDVDFGVRAPFGAG